jgi:hypothetical protein
MTADDEELDGELRRLFGDARLDVRPREGAEEAVVAGARRIRRRRAARATVGGALTAVLLVAGSLALTGPQSTPDTEPIGQALTPPAGASNRTTSMPRPMSTDSPSLSRGPLLSGPVLGPTGYGTLKLGMSFQDAKATEMLAGADTPPTSCMTYQLSEGTSAVSSASVSPTGGVFRFTADGARTPEGIEVGSTSAQLRAAYRDLAKGTAAYTASTGSGGSYVFYVDDQNVVTSWELIGPAGTC